MSAFALAIAGVGAAGMVSPARADSHDISIVDFEYQPASVTVFTGEPVTWTNEASQAHTVTADDGSFDSGELGPGEAFGHVFDAPGTFAYHDTGFPDTMKGTVVVKAAPATAVPSGSPEPTPPSGTLPPNFSPFPSTGPLSTPTPTPEPTPTPAQSADTTGTTSGDSDLLIVAIVAVALVGGVVLYEIWRRRTT